MRKLVIMRDDGKRDVMSEVEADDESQLHDIVKESPDLIPSEELGVSGQLMVVGRETSLQSGYADLLCLSSKGDLVVIELKTGPKNADFRRVLAQLIDYGTDLWRMSYEEFESAVTLRYFASSYSDGEIVSGQKSLSEAAVKFWPEMLDEDLELFKENLSDNLASGNFHYVLVSQKFTPSMEKTIEYLNFTTKAARFYAVELVKFSGSRLSVFEARTILKPDATAASEAARSGSSGSLSIGEQEFLGQIPDISQRDSLENLLEGCRGLGFRIGKGKRGLTIRIPVQDRSAPVTVAWLFPPGVTGWMGFTNLTFGFDNSKLADQAPATAVHIEKYAERINSLNAGEKTESEWLSGQRLSLEAEVQNHDELLEILASLMREASE